MFKFHFESDYIYDLITAKHCTLNYYFRSRAFTGRDWHPSQILLLTFTTSKHINLINKSNVQQEPEKRPWSCHCWHTLVLGLNLLAFSVWSPRRNHWFLSNAYCTRCQQGTIGSPSTRRPSFGFVFTFSRIILSTSDCSIHYYHLSTLLPLCE